MIKGLTPSLSEAGKIKIGGLGEVRKSEGGGTYRLPVKYDHFVITKTTRNKAGDLEIDEGVMRALPNTNGKLLEIPIVLHSDDIDEVFPTSYVMYHGKKRVCYGDGESATRTIGDPANKTWTDDTKQIPCVCPYYTDPKSQAKGGRVVMQCKPHGTLHCSILVPSLAIAGAVYKWRTTSEISITRMLGSLQQILAVCGTLRGIPLVLKLLPYTVSPDGKTTTVYSCHVELRAFDLLAVQDRALKAADIRQRLGGDRGQTKVLVARPGSSTESPDEQAEVWAEFHQDAEPEEAAPPPSSTTEAVKQAAVAAAGGRRPRSKEATEIVGDSKALAAAVDYGKPDNS